MSIRSIASVGLLAGLSGIASVGYLDAEKRPIGGDDGYIPWQYTIKLSRSTIAREIEKGFPVEAQRLTVDKVFPGKVEAKVGKKVAKLAGNKEKADKKAADRVAEKAAEGGKRMKAAEAREAEQRLDAAALREDQLVLLLLEELLS